MKPTPVRAITALISLIILATLKPHAVAQSREASILGSLISVTEDSKITDNDTIGGHVEEIFSALVRSVGAPVTFSGQATPDGRTTSAPLSFISGAFSSSGFYSSGASAGYTGTGAEIFRAYLRQGGPVTSGYGWRETFGRIHHGIDVAMAVGDTVRAALGGTVDRVGYQPGGYGHYVTISHDGGLETRYAHLSRPLVVPGQYVMAGEPVALSGNSGNSTGPHLHFETRRMGIPFNPLGDDVTMNQSGF